MDIFQRINTSFSKGLLGFFSCHFESHSFYPLSIITFFYEDIISVFVSLNYFRMSYGSYGLYKVFQLISLGSD